MWKKLDISISEKFDDSEGNPILYCRNRADMASEIGEAILRNSDIKIRRWEEDGASYETWTVKIIATVRKEGAMKKFFKKIKKWFKRRKR